VDLFDSVKAVISTEFEKTWPRKPGLNAVEVLVWLGDKEADLRIVLKRYKKNPPHVLKPLQREFEAVGGHGGLFEPSAFGSARDCVGKWVRGQCKDGDSVHIRFLGGAIEHRVGALVGILIASYKYIAIVKGQER